MKYAPKKVFILENGLYKEITYSELKQLKQADKSYMDKFFLSLHGMLTGADMANENKLNSDTEYVTHYANYPTDILKFSRDRNAVHPTQKPVALLGWHAGQKFRQFPLIRSGADVAFVFRFYEHIRKVVRSQSKFVGRRKAAV